MQSSGEGIAAELGGRMGAYSKCARHHRRLSTHDMNAPTQADKAHKRHLFMSG